MENEGKGRKEKEKKKYVEGKGIYQLPPQSTDPGYAADSVC